MVAKQQFYPENFLASIPEGELVHPHWLSTKFDCINKTTTKNLEKLELMGKVKRVQALGSREILLAEGGLRWRIL